MRTRTGEISIHVSAWKLLAKAVTPLCRKPKNRKSTAKSFATVLLPTSKNAIASGTPIWPSTAMCAMYLLPAPNCCNRCAAASDAWFLEVETPVLQTDLRCRQQRDHSPRTTISPADLYLRISFELYLKRLLVGGIERVYEIGRDFRNEGVSFKHNPIHSTRILRRLLNYEDVMNFVENMIRTTARDVLGTMKFNTVTTLSTSVDQPWPRITMRDAIKNSPNRLHGTHRR